MIIRGAYLKARKLVSHRFRQPCSNTEAMKTKSIYPVYHVFLMLGYKDQIQVSSSNDHLAGLAVRYPFGVTEIAPNYPKSSHVSDSNAGTLVAALQDI